MKNLNSLLTSLRSTYGNKILLGLGIFSIVVALGTWVFDFMHLVEPCIYCRTQRTVIGLLGVLLLLPVSKYISIYLSAVLGFFGSYVAASQIFLTIRNNHFSINFFLATAALFWIIFLVCSICFFSKR